MDSFKDTKYRDVTEQFFNAVKQMEPGKVKVIPNFDMLEGARALEMANARLDTGLIELSEEEIKFDATEAQSLLAVVSTMNKLFILYMSWLEGLSLLITVLSCRYMLEFLHSYTKSKLLKKSGFINPRIHPVEYMPSSSTESQLVNIVLRAFVIGLSKTIGFSLNVAANVLYDEEDLVTRSMNFDFLSQVSTQIVNAEIEEAELWLSKQTELKTEKNFLIATNQLKLVKALVRLEDLLRLDINLFHEPISWGLPHKASTLKIIDLLKPEPFEEFLPAAFSRFVQLDCDNKHLPSQNVEINQTQAYDGLQSLIVTLDSLIQKFTQIRNTSQLQTFLRYDIGFELATKANALARGIFQLFFIRDDRSIAGLNENVGSVTTRILEGISLCGNTIMDPSQWNIQNTKNPESTKGDCINKLAELLNDLEAASLHKLGSYGNNRCRQRQINNKNIVLWDSLHFNAETIETELFGYGIGDRLSSAFTDQPAYGLSAYIFFEKLDTMIDVALSGFEQDLYNPHEAPIMYWYASELCTQAYHLITERLIKINAGKLSSSQSLQKKIKSTKAGPKKEALKAEHSRMKEKVAPILEDNIIFLEKYLALSQLSLGHSTKGISMAIGIMKMLCNNGERPSNLATDEQLYKLRMKPWSSVGVPEVPSYEYYLSVHHQILGLSTLPQHERKEKIIEVIQAAKIQLNQATSCCQELCQNLENEKVLQERTNIGDNCEALLWFKNLRKTCEVYKAQLSRMESNLDGSFKIKRVDGCLQYFPIYSVVLRT